MRHGYLLLAANVSVCKCDRRPKTAVVLVRSSLPLCFSLLMAMRAQRATMKNYIAAKIQWSLLSVRCVQLPFFVSVVYAVTQSLFAFSASFRVIHNTNIYFRFAAITAAAAAAALFHLWHVICNTQNIRNK